MIYFRQNRAINSENNIKEKSPAGTSVTLVPTVVKNKDNDKNEQKKRQK